MKKDLITLSVALWASNRAVAHPTGPPSGPTATIESGVVIGVATSLPQASTAVNKFLGIPYAAPAKRWTTPKRAVPWRQPLNATGYGPACIQAWTFGPFGPDVSELAALVNNPPLQESEDCLTINVYAPASPGAPRAVMAMLVGGGFQTGGSGSSLFDATPFAAYEDVVAVSFNYRTNIFGFQGSPEIPLEERNLGILDQRFALDWIQRNIHAFGGDPAKVTVWGTSAGAESADAHLMMYDKAKPPPFRAAILGSGFMSVGIFGLHGDNAASWQGLVAAANCTSAKSQLQCVKALPATTLKQLQETGGFSFAPVIDNVTIPANPAMRRRDGNFAKVPVLIGTVAEEGRTIINRHLNVSSFADAFLHPSLVPEPLRQAILAAYPKGQDGLQTDFDVEVAIFTDFIYQCPAAILARQTADAGVAIWRYYYNASAPSFLPAEIRWLNKFHGVDDVLLFNNPGDTRHTSQTYTLSHSSRSALARFIKNPGGGPGWPAVRSTQFNGVDVGVFGDARDAPSGGVTATAGAVLDRKCALYKPVLDGIAGFTLPG